MRLAIEVCTTKARTLRRFEEMLALSHMKIIKKRDCGEWGSSEYLIEMAHTYYIYVPCKCIIREPELYGIRR